MNFKPLAAAYAAAASLAVLSSAPAQAAPTTGAYRTPSELIEFTCDHSVRVNANGHNVNDIVFFDGGKRYELSVIVWSTNGVFDYAEGWYNGERFVSNVYEAKNGSWCLDRDGSQFCFN